ncbi:substrate-binding domain-containing protein [Nocardioides donggukensis]|uniref:Substrate-binding domain-containing protein n=1 Tax=Nocardioides donggukensis TaxID=2774019 RepID=A0A927K4E1_9ACTN|nr:substrate-binding domain-containing protein [Nocardioides donggukensis]MBD8868673.1 substrate-binding domain-containing protein [Nocardioides donggukensis]
MGTGSHARKRAHTSKALAGLVLMSVSAGAGVGWLSSPVASQDECADGTRIELAAAPAIAPVLEAAAARETHGCTRVVVTATGPADALADLLAGGEGAPELWVPDSTMWVDQLTASGGSAKRLAASLATSPVLLAGGPSADAPDSWFAALASGRVSMRDPLAHGSAALALVAPRAESAESGVTPEQVQARLVPVAQKYGEHRAAAPDADPMADMTATSQMLVPVTEQEFLNGRRTNRALTAVLPRTGAPMAAYPLVAASSASPEALEAGRALAGHLEKSAGRELLAEHHFRGADGAPLAGGIGLGRVDRLALPSAAEAQADLRTWEVLTVPSSILAVLDASRSMGLDAGGRSRIELAAAAAGSALERFPGNARVGLWLFSGSLGGPQADHRELAPLKRLAARSAGRTQREVLATAVQRAVGLARGAGTGLHDTTLAAFREATEKYDPAYFNAVVVITDGADDPDPLGHEQLLEALRAEMDPNRPVRIIAIGIGEDTDMASLTAIAETTNGSAYLARDPRDVLEVVGQALLAR